MLKPPLVSVIMPLYNKRSYVKRAIDSVINQTFTDWELIVVDDGSTDDSMSEIPKNEQRIRLFTQTNAGPASARNHGIRKALGEFVTFIDADDYYYSQKLEQEMTFFHENNTVEWMVSAFDHETENQVNSFSFRDFRGNEIQGRLLVFDNAFLQLKISGWHIDGLILKKKLLNRVGGFRESMRWLEITDFQIRCALVQPKVAIYTIPLFRVIDAPESASKIIFHRIEGMRQMGESLYSLSLRYPEFSQILTQKSRESLLSHVTGMIRSNRKSEARAFLFHKFPYQREKKWLKLWIRSWVPNRLLEYKIKNRSE